VPLPGFTATDSCYRSSRSYAGWHVPQSSSRSLQDVTPAEFHCFDDNTCTCEGLDNCIQMFDGQLCSQRAACDSTDGLVCGCVKA
jgi:hypothetical protein